MILLGDYLKQFEKLINYINEKYGHDSTLTYDNVVNKVIEIMESNKCKHIHTEYQAEELDTNTKEHFICLDCGVDLDMPEPNYD